MVGWIILLIAAIILAIWLSWEIRQEEGKSDPMSPTDSGYESSRFEQNVYNRVYANEINRRKNPPKSKKKSSKK